MHGSVRRVLESLLAAANPSPMKGKPGAWEAAEHAAKCNECASELASMRRQAEMLKSLRAPEVLEPTGGFYARVLQRIEQSAKRSIWWVFVYSPIGKRLAYASLALSIALGSYVIAAESIDGHWSIRSAAAVAPAPPNHYDPVVIGDADTQRAAVLANFVSHPVAQARSVAQDSAVSAQSSGLE